MLSQHFLFAQLNNLCNSQNDRLKISVQEAASDSGPCAGAGPLQDVELCPWMMMSQQRFFLSAVFGLHHQL